MAPDIEKMKKEFEVDIRAILTSAARVGCSLRDLVNEYTQIKEEFDKPNYLKEIGCDVHNNWNSCFPELMKFKHVCFFDSQKHRFFVQANDEKTKHILDLVYNTSIRNRRVPDGCRGPSATRASGFLSKPQLENYDEKKQKEVVKKPQFNNFSSNHVRVQRQNNYKVPPRMVNNIQHVQANRIRNDLANAAKAAALGQNKLQQFRNRNFEELENRENDNPNKNFKNLGPRFFKNENKGFQNLQINSKPDQKQQHPTLVSVFSRLGDKSQNYS